MGAFMEDLACCPGIGEHKRLGKGSAQSSPTENFVLRER
ncbi:uncharacterized protein G2W53_022043 [Senna tora]|uniref:Uncharacterized protein n=1 Tax=Senna tora TaxID=362788 RepID=A0A834TMB6_9FABA|nr:uncharacterized protein G2W53_022043 [Senna tora]